MYQSYWGLKEKPFINTPDPKYLYYSNQHQEGLSRLLYACTERIGACMLTGVFGCGKTVLAQALLEELNKRGNYKVAFILNPALTHIELLRAICYYLGATGLPDKKSEILTDSLLEKLEEILHNNAEDGKETVVLIDEAHLIEDKLILEELRLLLNFQLKDRFLLTLILLGQPELKKNIDSIKQLSQRIAIRYHLDRLSYEETKTYILHRLKVAGKEAPIIFNEEAVKIIHSASGGIPRRINHICDLSLLSGFGKSLSLIDVDTVQDVVKDLES